MFSGLSSWFSSLLSFDVGTDRVPHDMVAQIHKDEMIIPASEANMIRSGRYQQAPAHITNHFAFSGPVTRDTQSQVAHAARIGMMRAQRKNG